MTRALRVLVLVLLGGLLVLPARAHAAPEECTVRVSPADDVRRAVAAAGAGAVVCLAPGRYELRAPIRPRRGQTLRGAGAVLDGSRVLTGFRRTRDGWLVGGQRQQGARTGTCRRGAACTYPDDVLRDGRPLVRVLDRGRLRPGRFWFDYRHDRIVVADDPRGHRLEALVAEAAVVARPGGRDVSVRGLVVERFATRAQHGAIAATAPGWTIAGTVVRDNHGAGITSTGQARILRNEVRRNGQLGIGGTGADTVVAGNVIAGNGHGGFDPAWEAGGAKWAVTEDLVVRGNRVLRNGGPGLWTDIDAQRTTYADNVVRDNDGPGIFHEISAAAEIRDNTVTGNGRAQDTWLWGSGILLAGSHDVAVARNRLARNAAGIGLVQQDRGTSGIDGSPRTLHDVRVVANVVDLDGGPTGGVTDNGYDAMFTDPTIVWEDNRWSDVRGRPFWWADRELTWEQWRRWGHDDG